MHELLLRVFLGITVIVVLGAISIDQLNLFDDSSDQITVYKLESCGCCTDYVGYLSGYGFTVDEQTVDDLTGIKSRFSIPESLWSCHTTVIGDYVVEGHVPIEVIRKLLNENPSIDGVALPGMPLGSPGMGGVKSEPFIIYSFGSDGIKEYTRF